jgi:hypothetical protein
MVCTRKASTLLCNCWWWKTHENSQVHYYKVMKFLHSRIMNISAMP